MSFRAQAMRNAASRRAHPRVPHDAAAQSERMPNETGPQRPTGAARDFP